MAACGNSHGATDAGSDGGSDAGPPLTDGGALGSACTSLAVCAGNPTCSDLEQCSVNVICANGICAEAGGAPNAEAVTLGFTSQPLPSYLQIYLFAPQLVGSGTLDCPTLLAGLDAGTLDLGDATELNSLVATYEQSVGITSDTQALNFELNSAASGSGRVLFIEGYLNVAGLDDGGANLIGGACVTFNDTDAGLGMTSATLGALW